MAKFVSTTEMIAVKQACPFPYVDVMVSTYTTCPGRQMDAIKLTVETVSETTTANFSLKKSIEKNILFFYAGNRISATFL